MPFLIDFTFQKNPESALYTTVFGKESLRNEKNTIYGITLPKNMLKNQLVMQEVENSNLQACPLLHFRMKGPDIYVEDTQ